MNDQPRRRRTDPPSSEHESESPPVTTGTPRRRAGDAFATAQPKSKRRKARDFFQRFRQPLIGLGLVGAAAPLIKSETAEPQPEPDLREDEEPETSAQPGADLEDRIAERIATTRAEDARADTVQYAIDRYDIDRQLAEAIYDQATQAGIEPKLAFGLVKTESAFRHNAISHVGARGLTQVMPRTAAWLRPGTRAQDLEDRNINLSLGFKYLNQLIEKYDGDVKLALLAYNRGPGTVDRILRNGGNPDNGYARKVMDG